MTKCRNCGHNSHCNESLEVVIDQIISGKEDKEVNICNKCQCDKCLPKTDWG
jgi:hypothetical protein